MYLLFETIRIKNGIAENLSLHQQRVNRTFIELGAMGSVINLNELIYKHPDLPLQKNGILKCKVQYDLNGNSYIKFEPYQIRKIRTISLQEIGQNDYHYKYTNRNWLQDLLTKAGTDEIILTKNGYITDASYANLAFYNGDQWITPLVPLLKGTRRAQLIEEGILSTATIHKNQLSMFKYVKIINAMMLWDESPLVEIAF
jgi:4-amino-4-deoxychorismate lyase